MEKISNSSIQIRNYLPENGDEKIEDLILSDLKGFPKKISSMFFYDAIGSTLFEEITQLPEYYLTRTEIDLLKKEAQDIKEKCHHVDIVEFGSGDCAKISILLDAIPKRHHFTIRYIPFDVSQNSIQKSSNILLKKYPRIKIYGIVADFMNQLEVIPKNTKKIICFLGSTIGNFSFQTACKFLSNLRNIMGHEDLLLLGFDMVKNKDILENAYNDKKQITEQFNKNILSVINAYIGSSFETDCFEHVAFYNESLSRVEMHLKANKDLEIICPGLSTPLFIKKGEMIHTENSYKFSNKHIRNLASAANLKIKKITTDNNNWFSLVQLTRNEKEG